MQNWGVDKVDVGLMKWMESLSPQVWGSWNGKQWPLSQITIGDGFSPTPSEKIQYAEVKLDYESPRFGVRGENQTYLSCHHLDKSKSICGFPSSESPTNCIALSSSAARGTSADRPVHFSPLICSHGIAPESTNQHLRKNDFWSWQGGVCRHPFLVRFAQTSQAGCVVLPTRKNGCTFQPISIHSMWWENMMHGPHSHYELWM